MEPHNLSEASDDYREKVISHLAEYKLKTLHVTEDGIWRRNGKKYCHILPEERRSLNILEPNRDKFWAFFEKRRKRIPLHNDFHHLNSSQAMCFNLFFPFIEEGCRHIQVLSSALGLGDDFPKQAEFEFVPDPKEGTQFDFFLALRSGRRLFFELKYTEREFGSAQQNENRKRKFTDLYQPRLADRFLPAYCTMEQFLRHYQVMRNIWHINRESHDSAFFIFPRKNIYLMKEAWFIRECTSKPFSPCARVMYLEGFIERLKASITNGHPQMRQHFSEFKHKYII